MSSKNPPHFVICVDNADSEDLQIRRLYPVVADAAAAKRGMIRVIDDSGEDYLYPKNKFVDAKLTAAVEQALASTVKVA